MAVINNVINAPIPFVVSKGGTGTTTLASNGLLLGNTTSAVNTVAPVATGSVLISNGTGSAPSYSSSPTVSGTLTANLLTTSGGQINGVIGINGVPGGNIQIATVPPGVVSLSTGYNAVVPLRFAGNAGANYVGLQAPGIIGTSFTLTLPATSAMENNAPIVCSTAGVLTFGTSVSLGAGSSATTPTTGSIVFYNSSNNNTVTIQSGVAAGNVTYTLPTADGTAGQVLSTNGSGVLSWVTKL